jgi:hypothetical protein
MKAMKHEPLLRAMDEGDVPTQEPESQVARMRRVLSIVGPSVAQASRFTFTDRNARAATQRAQAGNEGVSQCDGSLAALNSPTRHPEVRVGVSDSYL